MDWDKRHDATNSEVLPLSTLLHKDELKWIVSIIFLWLEKYILKINSDEWK